MARVADRLTKLLSVLVTAGLLTMLVSSIEPAQKLLWRLVIGIPLVVLTALNTIFGFTLISYFRPVRDWIHRKLLIMVGITQGSDRS
jgi:predicted RND superfamily exporter protein